MYLCLSCALLYGVKMPRLCALFSPFHRVPVRECVGFLRAEIIPHFSHCVQVLFSFVSSLSSGVALTFGVYAHNCANFTHTNERAKCRRCDQCRASHASCDPHRCISSARTLPCNAYHLRAVVGALSWLTYTVMERPFSPPLSTVKCCRFDLRL